MVIHLILDQNHVGYQSYDMCDKDRKILFQRDFRRYGKDEVEVQYDQKQCVVRIESYYLRENLGNI